MNNLGYACINMHLREEKDVWTGRSLIKRTYEDKGLDYVSSLVVQNTKDLIDIIKWNAKNNIRFYRMSCNMFPFIDWYEFEDLKDFEKIVSNLQQAGSLAQTFGQRITQHPDHFVKLASPNNPELVEKSIRTLEQQARVFDLMGLQKSVYNSINIHVGGAYDDKQSTAARFCDTFRNLSNSVTSRLTIENDDKPAMYTIKELHDYIYSDIGVPLVFDSLHYECHPGNLSYQESLDLAVSTWPEDIKPVVHHSNSKKRFEDESSKINGHTDYYYEPFQDFGNRVDIMLECKTKEQGLFLYKGLELEQV